MHRPPLADRLAAALTALSYAGLVFAAALATVLAVADASAQDRVPIRFERGASGTTINGAIRGREYVDYVLSARGGQRMVVSLRVTGTNGNGTAYFNILPAGRDFGGPYIGNQDDDRRADVIVPRDGDWAIRVYLLGNDRDTGRTVGYSIDVSILPGPGGGSGGSGGSAGGGFVPEADFFEVALANPNGTLNIRQAPRANSRVVGRVRNGAVLRNIGGCTRRNGRQWCNVRPRRGGTAGWVAGRYLVEAGRGNAGSNRPPASSGGAFAWVRGVPAGDVLNVRRGPGTRYRVVGALGNGDRVRRLGCERTGNATWCEIEMQTDMRARGWVNARYLTGASAGQLPLSPPDGQVGSGERVRTERVRFAPGASSAALSGSLATGARIRYLLNAREGEELTLRLQGRRLTYQILNPDRSLLQEVAPAGQDYRGQLWQSGDHGVEVINRSGRRRDYRLHVAIDAANRLPEDALAPGTAFNASGYLSCSARAGGRLRDCEFGVMRRGNGNATLVVALPGGGSREIVFRRGRPVATDAAGAVSHRRRGDTMIVHIGDGERFEIADAVIHGG